MAINYDGPNGLFPRLRLIFTTLESLETYQRATIKADMDGILGGYTAATTDADHYARVEQMVDRGQLVRQQTDYKSTLKTLVQNEITEQIRLSDPAYAKKFEDALRWLIVSMSTDGQTVRENLVTVSTTNPNTQAPQVYVDTETARGFMAEQAYPEIFKGIVDAGNYQFRGKDAAPSKLDFRFPQGSGVNKTLAPQTPEAGFLSNQVFDSSEALDDNYPAGWVVTTGQLGTTVIMTGYASQQIIISGTPTAGWYTITLTSAAGDVQTTGLLSYDATGAAVQTAIRALQGYSAVTVQSAGTAPNYTHTITFNEIAGAPPSVSVNNNTTGGLFAFATPVAPDTNALRNRAVAFVGDGAELTNIEQTFNNGKLDPIAVYGHSVRLKVDAAATGSLEISLRDGTGAVTKDVANKENKLVVDIATVPTTEFISVVCQFRTPADLPDLVKLDIRLATAMPASRKLYIDDLIFAPSVQLYNNGPFGIAFAGAADAPADYQPKIDVNNDYAGRIQTWFGRLFNVELPSITSGSETIPDS